MSSKFWRPLCEQEATADGRRLALLDSRGVWRRRRLRLSRGTCAALCTTGLTRWSVAKRHFILLANVQRERKIWRQFSIRRSATDIPGLHIWQWALKLQKQLIFLFLAFPSAAAAPAPRFEYLHYFWRRRIARLGVTSSRDKFLGWQLLTFRICDIVASCDDFLFTVTLALVCEFQTILQCTIDFRDLWLWGLGRTCIVQWK